MMRTLGSTNDSTIREAPKALHQLKGFMLSHEHDIERQGLGDTSWFQMVRTALDYATNLAEEACEEFLRNKPR